MALTRRTLLGLTGGLAATAGLAACGTNTGRPSAASTAAGKPALAHWYHKYGEDGVEAAVKKYAAEFTDAAVNVTWTLADYEKALGAALLTPTAPDVFEYANGPTLDMIQAGQVADLTDVVGSARADFAKPVMDRLTYKGKVYAIPQTIDMQLLYYRKSVLAKANVQPPKTLDELVAAAKAVKTSDMSGFFAGNDGGLGVLGSIFIWSAGLSQLNADRTAPAFNDPALYAAVAKYKELFDSGALLKSGSGNWFEATSFTNGETAMQWGGLWDLPKVAKAFGDDFGVLPFPAAGASGKQVVPFGAFSASVNAKSANVELAKQYVKWLWIDQEAKQVEFSNAFGTHIPAKPKLFAQASQVASGPGADAARFVTELGQTSDLLWTSATDTAYGAALSNVIKNGADPRAEFTAAAEKAAAELKRVGG